METTITKMPKEVQEVSDLCLQMHLDHSKSLDVSAILGKCQIFSSYVEKLYHEWFPSAKSYSDEHIAEQIFVTSIDEGCYKDYLKYEMWAFVGSMNRIMKDIGEMQKDGGSEEQIQDEIKLLCEIALEGMQFLDEAHLHLKGTGLHWGHIKRGQSFSLEIFNASQMLLREKIWPRSFGEFVMRPTAAFLIRQAIDVRIKNAFSIYYICDDRGKPLPISWSYLIELIRDNPNDIQFPMKPSVVLKIHNWTQVYIHLGKFPYTWEIELAQLLLLPLFASGENVKTRPDGGVSKEWNMFGSIRITQSFYDRIEDEIKDRLRTKCTEGVKIIRLRIKPEALIVDKFQ